jgi:hypothetical protein
MAAGTQVTTLADLRTDLLERLREQTGVTATNTIADRFINVALHDMHISPGGMVPWALRRGVLISHAPYTTGNVSIAAATRTTVAGSGTAWSTAVPGFGFNNTRVGGKITFSGREEIYEVTAVGSDTSITIGSIYTGAALTSASYVYFEDEYALASDFLRFADLRLFSSQWNIPLIGQMEFRRMFARNDTRSKPRVATQIDIGFSGSTSPRPRVVFYPVPDDEYSIPYDYVTSNLAVTTGGTEQVQLTNDTDEPIVPLRARHAIVLHALYHWYRDRKDDSARAQQAKAEYIDLMRRILGDTMIGQDRPRIIPGRIGVGRGPLGRYDVGNRFDELRDRWW